MSVPATVVVNAAGMGSRLGLDRPKALLEIAGRPLIHWQLDMLRWVDDVRVVVGYHAPTMADAVFAVRPDAMIVRNPDYRSTGTAASLMLGAARSPGLVVSLDCDLVVHPDDLEAFILAEGPLLGVVPQQSIEPVTLCVDGAMDGTDPAPLAVSFERDTASSEWEWSGLVTFDPCVDDLGPTDGHVFRMIEPLLPLPVREIRAREIDFADEIPALEDWVNELCETGVIGDGIGTT